VISIVVADDQPLVRLGLRVLIETENDLDLVGEAEDGRSALAVVRRTRPDVALLDIRMPKLDGLGVLKAIVAEPALASTRVVIVTTFALDEYLFEALRSGASGFVVKDADPAELLHAIRVVAAGESLLSPTMTRRLISAFTARPALHAPDLSELTTREREITALAGHGLSKRRDRDTAGHQPGHGSHARKPGDAKARRPRPRPTSRVRSSGRSGDADWMTPTPTCLELKRLMADDNAASEFHDQRHDCCTLVDRAPDISSQLAPFAARASSLRRHRDIRVCLRDGDPTDGPARLLTRASTDRSGHVAAPPHPALPAAQPSLGRCPAECGRRTRNQAATSVIHSSRIVRWVRSTYAVRLRTPSDEAVLGAQVGHGVVEVEGPAWSGRAPSRCASGRCLTAWTGELSSRGGRLVAHVVVRLPGSLALEEAHRIESELEKARRRELPELSAVVARIGP